MFSGIQLKLGDNLYGGKTPLQSIVIVAVDDRSLEEFGRWPWNRDVIARAIDCLNASKVIGIDVAFFESSENDAVLIDAVDKANVVLPIEFTSFAKEDNRIVGKRFLRPISGLENAKLGYVNILTDHDGVSRAVNMDLSSEYKNFAYVVYKEFWKSDVDVELQRFLINFVGAPGSFSTYSIADVVNRKIPASEFEDKLVLIGVTAPDLHDDYFVPTSKGKAMPGVEIHANVIQALINRDFLREQPKAGIILLMFSVSLLLAFVFYKFRMLVAIIISPVLMVAYLFIAIYVFNFGIILDLVYVPLAVVFACVSEIVLFYTTEKKAKAQIKNAFSKYVSAAVVGEIMKDPERLKLGGVRRVITVFFSDIRGFTSISEKLRPEELVHVLNEYFSAMAGIIMKHDGVVDKYIGDAIMAFWGAPLERPDHAVLACSTGLDMIRALEQLQKKWEAENFPRISIGIGLNSGPAVIGNMGSYERFDYTAMGDTVNVGSRLEGLTKVYGVNIIISESTKKQVKDGFITRKLDLVRVKGKNEPVMIYELICRKGELMHDRERDIALFEKGLAYYFNREWAKAINEFKKVDDFASKEFIGRCEAFRLDPPGKSWDGVWTMKSK